MLSLGIVTGVIEPSVIRRRYISGCLVEADMGVVKFPDGYTFPMPSKVEVTQYNSYVRRIDFSGGHVLFNLSPDINEGLRSMEVYDLSGNLVKRVMFNQTYTGTTFSLRLDSVSIESPDEFSRPL